MNHFDIGRVIACKVSYNLFSYVCMYGHHM